MPLHRDPYGNIIEEKSKPTPSPNVKRDENTLPKSDGANRSPAPQRGGQVPDTTERLKKDTVPTDQRSPAPGGGGQDTRRGGSNKSTKPGNQSPSLPDRGQVPRTGRLEKDTVPAEQRPKALQPGGQAIDAGGSEKKERTYRKISGRTGREDPQPAEERTEKVVGWLVIVSGPGKGSILQLRYGYNTIGRDKTADVQLDFGDNQISSIRHATVCYFA